jgi:glutaredoxin-like protein
MAFLHDEDRRKVQDRLKGLVRPVTLTFFTQVLAGACRFCSETEQLLRELVSLSDRLSLDVKNFLGDKKEAEAFRIDKIPAICAAADKDIGIRWYGIPSGYEFAAFLDTLIRVSTGDSGLSDPTRAALKALERPVHLQVFVTPTCPYCPSAALTGLQMAQESDRVTCDVIEISEFAHLAQKYAVLGVPKVVINENTGFEGAVKESDFLEQVLRAGASPSVTA